MKLLLIGNGGREHAIAWKLVQSDRVARLFVAPGNGGTDSLPKTENVAIAAHDLPALRDFALAQEIDFTVVGPEVPLGRRSGGPVSGGRFAHLWAHQSRRAVGRLQSVFQSIYGTGRHSHRPSRDLH